MKKKVKYVQATRENFEQVVRANDLLARDEHMDDCPVFCNASSTCVWPIAVCVPEDFNEAVG